MQHHAPPVRTTVAEHYAVAAVDEAGDCGAVAGLSRRVDHDTLDKKSLCIIAAVFTIAAYSPMENQVPCAARLRASLSVRTREEMA